jgi:hypothetical protein
MPRRTHDTDFTTLAPRIGFAYRIGEKTVIRGGVGTFYQSDTSTNNTQTGFSQGTGYTSSFNVGGSPFPRPASTTSTASPAAAARTARRPVPTRWSTLP